MSSFRFLDDCKFSDPQGANDMPTFHGRLTVRKWLFSAQIARTATNSVRDGATFASPGFDENTRGP
jgi:hypothetical protein